MTQFSPRFTFKKLALLGVASAFSFSAFSAQAATEIQFWHAMQSALGERVKGLAERFNASQSDYKIVPVFKGSYPETMTAGIAAYRAKSAPHILQVFEVGTATMMGAKGAIKPVEEMMKEAGEKFNGKAYIPAVAGYYSSAKGQMISFPFNSSTTILYYNKDMFEKAGLDSSNAPKTWNDVMNAAVKLKTSGATQCAYTTGWPSWVHMENFAAWHNLPLATKNNGFGGFDARLTTDTPLMQRHLQNLADWNKQGLFTYGGRTNEAEAKFYGGECAILTSSSGARATIEKSAKFKFGVGTLPYYDDVEGAPQNTIIGGASLWVMNGKSKEEYKGVAKFFSFLSQPEIQAEWHQGTGYLPITIAAYELTKQSGFYEKNPGTEIPVQQMIVKTTDKSRGLRLGNMPQIRDVFAEELEQLLGGKIDAQTALKNTNRRANELLERFQKTARE